MQMFEPVFGADDCNQYRFDSGFDGELLTLQGARSNINIPLRTFEFGNRGATRNVLSSKHPCTF